MQRVHAALGLVVEVTIAETDRARRRELTLSVYVSLGRAAWASSARTGTGAHLSAFAPESTGTLLLPLVSHPKQCRESVEATASMLE